MWNRCAASIIGTVALVLCACSAKPLPPDKQEFVGHWRGVGVELTITPDGGLSYHRVRGSGSTSVNAPIKGFSGDDFDVGIGFFSTRFHVTAPPHRDGSTWKMTVDEVELSRTDVAGPSSDEPPAGPSAEDVEAYCASRARALAAADGDERRTSCANLLRGALQAFAAAKIDVAVDEIRTLDELMRPHGAAASEPPVAAPPVRDKRAKDDVGLLVPQH